MNPDGLDLRQIELQASPASIAGQLKARGLLPALQGYMVVFSGLGIEYRRPAARAD